ncbi:hypothetical protein PQO01_11555 [Lentisphaera marina]|uniref:hypothetical protein n=1 Tax=Lentisphaera marina TaxID=1111041 RepID=UPI002365CA74|nr:hypothetical protein [Lentisphaera marina]MDD7985584.1 hypothetical protein [Lentisphaera marina]
MQVALKSIFLSSFIFFTTQTFAQVKNIKLSDLNSSLLPEVCLEYDGEKYSKKQSLNILKQYLLYYSGAPSDAITVKNFTRSSLEQYFAFKALYEISRNAGCAANLDEARKFYDSYSSRLSPSKLIEELSLLKLSKEEIIRLIYEKQSVQNYRKKLFQEQLIGEAEAMLYYHENTKKFIQSAGIKFKAYKLENPISSLEIQSFNSLLAQGLSTEKILQQKKYPHSTLKDQFISTEISQKSKFYPLLNAKLHQLQLVETSTDSILCLPIEKIESYQLPFDQVKEKIINSLKRHRVNKRLKNEIAQHLELKKFKLLIKL